MDIIRWNGEALALLDQNALPQEEKWITCPDHLSVAVALAGPSMPSGPSAGIAAAYAYYLAAKEGGSLQSPALDQVLDEAAAQLKKACPNEISVAHAISRMEAVWQAHRDMPTALMNALLSEAFVIHRREVLASRAIGRVGADLLPEQARVLLHGLPTYIGADGFTPVLSILRSAWRRGKLEAVYLTEGGPMYRSTILAAWVLKAEGIPFITVTDSAVAGLMADRQVHLILAGSGSMAANGDLLAPAGTYATAICAYYHGLPFYSVLPKCEIDLTLPDGEALRVARKWVESSTPCSERRKTDLCRILDVTPAALISGTITEKEILYPPFQDE